MPYYYHENNDHVDEWFDDFAEPEQDGVLGEAKLNSFFEEDEFPDLDFADSVNSKYPGWYLVRITGFIASTFSEMKPWLDENVKFGQFAKVGWSSGCSSSVGVVFESGKDAMMFKLRWRD